MVPDTSDRSAYRPPMARVRQPDIKSMVRDWVTAEGGDPTSHLDRAAAALRIAAEADTFARAEVVAARELDSASWADVGDALGISRQAAHERFRLGPDGYHSRWYKVRSTR
jgi:uncharacterized protein (DUF849 family)